MAMTAELQRFDDGFEKLETSPIVTILNVWRVIWQRKSLVCLGLAIGLIFGALAYSQAVPVYQSSSQVLVVKKRPDVVLPNPLDQRGSFGSEDYLATHMVLLQSDEILRRAAKLVDASALTDLHMGGDYVSVIKSGLTVSRDFDKNAGSGPTNILNLGFRGGNPSDTPHYLNALIEGYKAFLRETYGSLNDETLNLIQKAQTVLNKELAEKQAYHQKLYSQHPLALKAKDSIGVLQDRINRIDMRRSSLLLRQKEIETRQKMVAKALEEGQSRSAILASMREKDTLESRKPITDTSSLSATLFELKLRAEELGRVFGENHPEMSVLRKRMEIIKDQMNRFGKDDASDPLDVMVQALKVEYEENKQLLQALTPILETEQAEAQSVAKFLIEEEEARNDVNRLRQLCDNIIERIRQINLTRESGGYDASVITPAKAGFKVAPKLFTYLSMAMIAGLALGICLAYLADFSDRSFRSPEEIRQRLGLHVLGHVPNFPAEISETAAEAEKVGPEVVAYHRPRSPVAEVFRSVRTSLFFSTAQRGHQVIQITSPAMGDGKSTIVGNLAVAIAQSGKRVIVVDADFRRPRVHKLFPTIDRHQGVTAVIDDEKNLDDVIQKSAVPNLWVAPSGHRPNNPAELLTSQRFREVIEELRSRFDFVIVDTPPVLVVSDASIVAPQVDGVILVIRLTKNNRPAAERAQETLASLDANLLGVIVNDSDNLAPRGNYGNYGYGGYYAGRRYSYSYSYNYSYGDPSAYAEEAEEDSGNPALPPAESNGKPDLPSSDSQNKKSN